MSELHTPAVLLIVFNRPDLTAKVFERIRQAAPSRLFIAADGPRENREGEKSLCKATREVTRAVDWECEIHRLEYPQNLGCKVAVSSAITWFFQHVNEGIILEDDCLPDLTFFRFCADLLDRYRDSPEIALVSGNHFYESTFPSSYYFSRYPQIWGWATWRRVWQRYDLEISNWTGDPRSLAGAVSNPRARRHFSKLFNSVKFRSKDTWDFQLIYLCLSEDLLCINPSTNLVQNIGFDERATHTFAEDPKKPLPLAHAMDFPLCHPPVIRVNSEADRYTEVHVRGIPANLLHSWARSFVKRFRRFWSRF